MRYVVTTAWTVGSLAALCGADAVTLPAVRGPLRRLLNLAGAPVYEVEARARDLAALAVDGLALVANLRPEPRVVDVAWRPVVLGPYGVAVVPR